MSSTLDDILGLVDQNYYLLYEAADHIGISKVSLWRWIKAGKVPVYRIGREVLIEKRVVEELKAKR